MPMETKSSSSSENNNGSTQNDTQQEQQQQQQQEQPPNYHPGTGLRILCLHDAHSSASSLKAALTMLGDRLYQKHGIDLVYINR